MKDKFKEYYRPTDNELSDIWKNCIFVLDANVLLNLYRYSESTSDEFLKILTNLKGSLWIPYQVAYEYHNRRLDVISQQEKIYNDLLISINKYKDETIKELLSSRHPFIENSKKLITNFEKAIDSIENNLNSEKEKCQKITEHDEIRDKISTILTGKVGDEYSEKNLTSLYELGKKRYDKKIPPGFEDQKRKKNNNEYGDFILWQQTIDFAKSKKKPIILVTDEKKDDWWLKFEGKIIGPRPELIKEMRVEAEVPFYMYRVDPFMVHAKKFLKQQIKSKAITEVRETRERDDKKATKKLYLDTIKNMHKYQEVERLRKLASNYDLEELNKLATHHDLEELELNKLAIHHELEELRKLAGGYDLEDLNKLATHHDLEELRKLAGGYDLEKMRMLLKKWKS